MSKDVIGFYACGLGCDSACPHTKYGPGSVDQNNALGEWLREQDKLRAREAGRLAAVRELVQRYRELYGHYADPDCATALVALRAVWPEAVGE